MNSHGFPMFVCSGGILSMFRGPKIYNPSNKIIVCVHFIHSFSRHLVIVLLLDMLFVVLLLMLLLQPVVWLLTKCFYETTDTVADAFDTAHGTIAEKITNLQLIIELF